MVRTIVALFFVSAISSVACSSGPQVGMRGKYTNENHQATLEITSDKMTASGGPMTFTANYTVLSISGSDVTVELTAPNTPKGRMVINVGDRSLRIRDSFLFGGTWTRQ